MTPKASELIVYQTTELNSTKFTTIAEEQLHLAISNILQHTDWQYSEVWLPLNFQPSQQSTMSSMTSAMTDQMADHTIDDTEVLLELSQIWAADTCQSFLELHAWENFWSCSRGFLVNAGEGLPGRAWSTHQWEWISDASTHSEHHFLRNQIARAFQVKAGLAVPFTTADHDYGAKSSPEGVALFFMSEGRGQDRWLIQNTLEILANYQFLTPKLS